MRPRRTPIDVQLAWMMEELDLPMILPLPLPRRLPVVAVVRPR